MKRSQVVVATLLLLLTAGACGERSNIVSKDDAGRASPASPSPEPEEAPDEGPGFRPPSTTQDGVTVMPLAFVDGSTAEVVADAGLEIEGMTAAIYTSGGIGDVDRTIDFQHGSRKRPCRSHRDEIPLEPIGRFCSS